MNSHDEKRKTKKRRRESEVDAEQPHGSEGAERRHSKKRRDKGEGKEGDKERPQEHRNGKTKATMKTKDVEMSSPFEEVDMRVTVSLLPAALANVADAIRKNLYDLVMNYNESVDGVVLAFTAVDFAEGKAYGRIFEEMPHVHFDVRATALVFRPAPGARLIGVINKVAATYVGMLVCGIFSASVPATDFGRGWEWHPEERCWAQNPPAAAAAAAAVGSGSGSPGGGAGAGAAGERMEVGGSVTFVVRRLQWCGGLVSIDGALEGAVGVVSGMQGAMTPGPRPRPRPPPPAAVVAAAGRDKEREREEEEGGDAGKEQEKEEDSHGERKRKKKKEKKNREGGGGGAGEAASRAKGDRQMTIG